MMISMMNDVSSRIQIYPNYPCCVYNRGYPLQHYVFQVEHVIVWQ